VTTEEKGYLTYEVVRTLVHLGKVEKVVMLITKDQPKYLKQYKAEGGYRPSDCQKLVLSFVRLFVDHANKRGISPSRGFML
jgi:hypothetical protein